MKHGTSMSRRTLMLVAFVGFALASPAMADTKLVKVALLLPGPISDGGWNQLAYDGLQGLDKGKYGLLHRERCHR